MMQKARVTARLTSTRIRRKRSFATLTSGPRRRSDALGVCEGSDKCGLSQLDPWSEVRESVVVFMMGDIQCVVCD